MREPETLTDWAALITIIAFILGVPTLPHLIAWFRGDPKSTDTANLSKNFPISLRIAIGLIIAFLLRVPPLPGLLAWIQQKSESIASSGQTLSSPKPVQPVPVHEETPRKEPPISTVPAVSTSVVPSPSPELPAEVPVNMDTPGVKPKPTIKNVVPQPEPKPAEPIVAEPKPIAPPTRFSGGAPSVHAVSIATQHNVRMSGQAGMAISVRFNADNMQGRHLYVAVYFFLRSGAPLRDVDRSYRSQDGQVSTGTSFIPQNQREWGAVTLEVPYAELHVAPNVHSNLEYQVLVFDRDSVEGPKVLYSSATRPFSVD